MKIVQYNSNHFGTGGADLYFIHPYMLDGAYVVGDEYIVKPYTHPTKVNSDGWILPENYDSVEFIGWNTEPDGSGTAHTPGSIIQILDEAIPLAAAPLAAPDTMLMAFVYVVDIEEVKPLQQSQAEPVTISLYAQWRPVEETPTPPPTPPPTPTPRAPQTGDDNNIVYLVLLLLVSSLSVTGIAIQRRRKRMRKYNW
jgi:LPXTG-motif cell wall-anchored protein